MLRLRAYYLIIILLVINNTASKQDEQESEKIVNVSPHIRRFPMKQSTKSTYQHSSKPTNQPINHCVKLPLR